MSDTIKIGRELSRCTPYFSLVDMDCLDKGYYVSGIAYRNEGEERDQSIHFTSPEGIDHLMFALTHAKTAAEHYGQRGRHDDTYSVVLGGGDGTEGDV